MAEETELAASNNGSANGSVRSGSSMSQFSPSRSLNAKRLRQVAENDVQFLANRIAKLKAEELRAKKEIDKTVNKTKEILSNRKTFENRAVDTLAIREQTTNSKKEERVLHSLNKDKQLKAIWVAKQKLLNDKKETVTVMRKQKDINECRLHIMREEERDKNSKRREEIKKQQILTKMKLEKEQEAKITLAQKRYEEKVKAEEAERERKEELARQLVEQEAQLIFRLKRLHMEKQKAIRDLASVVDVVKADEIEEEIEGDGEDEEPAEVVEEIKEG
mmetsp:Transcript_63477/g.113265  ORF Transcript_63477/g.113265 Transcript_63477/m.113265 type:complete len:276 (-) Transcript_63477:1144-1971(-)